MFPEDWRLQCFDKGEQELRYWANNECVDNCSAYWDHFLEPFEIRVMAAASKRCLEVREDIKQRPVEVDKTKHNGKNNERRITEVRKDEMENWRAVNEEMGREKIEL